MRRKRGTARSPAWRRGVFRHPCSILAAVSIVTNPRGSVRAPSRRSSSRRSHPMRTTHIQRRARGPPDPHGCRKGRRPVRVSPCPPLPVDGVEVRRGREKRDRGKNSYKMAAPPAAPGLANQRAGLVPGLLLPCLPSGCCATAPCDAGCRPDPSGPGGRSCLVLCGAGARSESRSGVSYRLSQKYKAT